MNKLSRALCVGLLLLMGSTAVAAEDLAIGEWHGVLATPTGQLSVLVRIRHEADGGYSGDLESVDQDPGQKIALTKVIVSAGKLSFTVPSISATYDGEWKAAEQVWSGVFRQGLTLPLLLERGALRPTAIVAGLDGTWRASLQRNGVTLPLVLHVDTTGNGTKATLDSPGLGVFGLAVQSLERAGETVHFVVPAAQVDFTGMLRKNLQTFSGRWSRQGQPEAQLTFERDAASSTTRVRTQWPITPNGYRAEEISFANTSSRGVTLAGTLTIPNGPGPFPAVILISGAGAQDRDETVFGHKPFAVLADHLSRHGIAVLRYDDRGFAASTGEYDKATSADFATDANSAFHYLLGRTDIRHGAIGFIGHSEGGMIAPIAAAANKRVAFVVLLAGPGTNTDQLVLSQRRLLGIAQGLSTEQLDATEPLIRSILAAARAGSNSRSAATRIRTLLTPETLQALGATSAQRDAIASQYSGAWMRYFLKYEPAAFLRRLRIPVLALAGALDRQVPAAENLAAIRVALANDADATVRELPGLNHMFQTAKTGAIGEYDGIAETFAPGAMDLIANWILVRFGNVDVDRARLQ